jgi:hypothetical protein
MKLKTIIPLIALLAATNSSAVIVAFSSLNGTFDYITYADQVAPGDNPILVAEGTGFAAVGFFSTIADGDLQTSTSTVLSNNFVIWGAPTTFGPGFYDGSADGGRINSASVFLSKNVYTILANASTIEDSTQFAIFKSNATFTQDDALAIPTTIDVNISEDGQFLMGNAGPQLDYGFGPFSSVTLQNAIPEPSALLLSSLSLLVLARRKR